MEKESFIDLRRVCHVAVAASFVISSFFLMIWLSSSAQAWRDLAGISMKPNTSLCLTTCAVAMFLLCYTKDKESANRWRFPIFLLGFFAVCVGAATLMEYWTDRSLGIDEIIVRDVGNAESALYPGRMSPIAAGGIFLLGSLTLLTFSARPFIAWLHQALTIVLMLISIFAINGYILGVSALYQVGPFIRISPYTAICLLLLAFAGLIVSGRSSVLRLVTSQTPGGMAIRRLLPMAIFLPPLIGTARLYGQRAGYYDLSQGTSISVITYMVLFSALIYRSGRALNYAFEEKVAAEQKFLSDLEFHAKSLERAVHARDEFLSIASHELKTPLTSLKMQVQMQRRFRAKQSNLENQDSKMAQFFDLAERQIMRLSRLIEDMLDIGRIETGKFRLHLEQFDLVALIKEIANQMSAEFHAAGSELELKMPPALMVQADKVRISQVLMNLLSNSCKYGAGSPVQLRVEENLSGEMILISVQDHGVGIAPVDQKRIFERFERAVPGNHVSGLGLGLFIVREIMDQHHGRISLSSKMGEGSRFTVEFPRHLVLKQDSSPEADTLRH